MTPSTEAPPPACLDGGLATTLQREGLAPSTPVETWVRDRPEAVRAAHLRFVDAGAEAVLTATLRTLPGLAPDWEAVLDRALALAPSPRWVSVGPCSEATRRWTPAQGDGAWRALGAALVARGEALAVCETFVDGDELVAAAGALISAGVPTVVASVVPGPGGRTLSGAPLGPLARRLAALGVAGLGVNCAPVADVAAALHALAPAGLPLWARPEGVEPPEAWARAVAALPARWLGGCCGAGPEHIAALAERLRCP